VIAADNPSAAFDNRNGAILRVSGHHGCGDTPSDTPNFGRSFPGVFPASSAPVDRPDLGPSPPASPATKAPTRHLDPRRPCVLHEQEIDLPRIELVLVAAAAAQFDRAVMPHEVSDAAESFAAHPGMWNR
jgi:hypothetical protein